MPVNQREEALVLASQNSDTNAFEELYQLYYDKIYALIMMTVKNSADTEDILQAEYREAQRSESVQYMAAADRTQRVKVDAAQKAPRALGG